MHVDSPRGQRHVAELLPEYVTGNLNEVERRRVERHLAGCAHCSAELEEWLSVATAERVALREAPNPSPALLSAVFAAIDAPTPVKRRDAPVWTSWRQAGRVALAQVRLLPLSLWIATTVGVALAALIALNMRSAAGGGVLVYTLPLIAATGTAFLYGPEIDPGLELAVATPTSQRMVLGSRFALLLLYNLALALLATLLFTTLHGPGVSAVWPLVARWLGPMALLSALSLALAVTLAPIVAAAAGAALWFARFFHFDSGISLTVPDTGLWQTSPLVLALSVALVAVAMIVAQRNERMPSGER